MVSGESKLLNSANIIDSFFSSIGVLTSESHVYRTSHAHYTVHKACTCPLHIQSQVVRLQMTVGKRTTSCCAYQAQYWLLWKHIFPH